jgi:penicillin-binding protein 1A
VRTPTGEVVYDAAASAPARERVLSDETVIGMIDMLHSVVEHGTARRARIPGVNVAGKTGTTNSYRDAWFVGFTGNFTTAVWLGNDDFAMTKRLTGGILPAETWQKYMRVAMAYEEVKPLPGLPPPEPAEGDLVAAADGGPELINPGPSGRLAPETANALGRLEERFRTATEAPPVRQAALGSNGTAAP